MENNIVFPLMGSMTGAGIYSTIGGIGIVGGFGGLSIGLSGITTGGTVLGFAAYGAVEGIASGDAAAFTSVGLGAIGGAGIGSTIGGVGVSLGGSAFGIGIGSMTAVGGIFGLGIYGLAKMFANSGTKESTAETFHRMEDKISYMEAYNQALMELNPLFADLIWEQKFSSLEIEDELEMLKAQIKFNASNKSKSSFKNSEKVLFDRDRDSREIELQPKYYWQLSKTISGHTNSINSFAIKNDILASASNDRTISIWNIETGRQIYSFFGSQELQAVAINNRIVAGGGFDRTITSWKLSDRTLEHIISKYRNPSSHNDVIYTLIFSNKGDFLITGSADKTIKVWNSVTGSLKFTLNGHTDIVNNLAISPCDRWLISSSTDRTIRIWDMATPLNKPYIIDEFYHQITAIATTPDGKYIIVADRGNCLRLWNLKTRKNIYIYENSIDGINSITVSPDGKLMAVGNMNSVVQIWNLKTKEISQTIKASSPVIFNYNGNYLITGDIHNRIQIWQKASTNSKSSYKDYRNKKWWQILGVSMNSSSMDIKTAYYNLAKQYHPDVNSSKEARDMMSTINRAYQDSHTQYT